MEFLPLGAIRGPWAGWNHACRMRRSVRTRLLRGRTAARRLGRPSKVKPSCTSYSLSACARRPISGQYTPAMPRRSLPERTVDGGVRSAMTFPMRRIWEPLRILKIFFFSHARIWGPTQNIEETNWDYGLSLGDGKLLILEDKGTTAVLRKRKKPLDTTGSISTSTNFHGIAMKSSLQRGCRFFMFFRSRHGLVIQPVPESFLTRPSVVSSRQVGLFPSGSSSAEAATSAPSWESSVVSIQISCRSTREPRPLPNSSGVYSSARSASGSQGSGESSSLIAKASEQPSRRTRGSRR